jgi:DNA-binding transcriptional regulator YiaG
MPEPAALIATFAAIRHIATRIAVGIDLNYILMRIQTTEGWGMSSAEFVQFLSRIDALSPAQMRQLFHVLETKLAATELKPAVDGGGSLGAMEGKLSSRGARIVKALNQFADDLAAGTPIETKYTVRQVRVIPKPAHYSPAQVCALRELIGASQEVFAQLLAVNPVTIRSWEQGLRQPSPIARHAFVQNHPVPSLNDVKAQYPPTLFLVTGVRDHDAADTRNPKENHSHDPTAKRQHSHPVDSLALHSRRLHAPT